jgi:hypothetical protein
MRDQWPKVKGLGRSSPAPEDLLDQKAIGTRTGGGRRSERRGEAAASGGSAGATCRRPIRVGHD